MTEQTPVGGNGADDSPCTRVCVIHPAEGICVGCLRTLDEIAGWARMTPEQRRGVLSDLPGRAPRLARRRGGRAGRGEARAGRQTP